MSSGAAPFIRWAGSKRKLIPILKEYWDNGSYDRYIEPFMGSAQLFYSINETANSSILGDMNSELIETYKRVKWQPKEVYAHLQKWPLGEDAYYDIRKLDVTKMDKIERAARFLYLNRFCFNGLYRTNNNGIYNVPYGADKSKNIHDWASFKAASSKLKHTKLICGDFEMVVKTHATEGDFIYLDPPYAVGNRRVFRQYGPDSFGISDLQRLRNLLIELDKRKIKFLLSYAYCKEAKDYFNLWPQRKIYTQRNIAGFSEHRRKAAEVLISNLH
jgi:DNA adenine methylase